MKKSKIIISTPEYREYTGGIIVMHKLGSILQSLGWTVAFAPSSKFKFWSPYDIPVASYVGKDTIVVYPKHADRNPLGANKIVNYYLGLNNPQPGFQLFYIKKWADAIGQTADNILFITDSKYKEFIDKGEPRHGDCFTVRKNKHPDFIHSPDAFKITRGMRNIDLIKIFNSHERFICYDKDCFLSTQAAMCGCDSIVIESPDDIGNFSGYGYPGKITYGVAYGKSGAELRSARLTRFKLHDYFEAIEQAQVERTRVMFEKIERSFT